MDPKQINWKIVGAVLIALGYVAYKNKGFKNIMKAASKHGTVAAVLGIVSYFGLTYVMGQVRKELPGATPADEDLPPEQQPPTDLAGYHGSIHEQGMPGRRVTGPGGYEATAALGC